MKRYLVLLFILGCTAGFLYSRAASPMGDINIDGQSVMVAGEEWDLSVSIDGGQAGDDVQIVLFNGLQAFHETLTLGTGGVAIWRIPAGQITQAGESILLIETDEDFLRYPITVLPDDPVEVDLFTTGNVLASYGEGTVTIMILPRDQWGNAPSDDNQFTVNAQYPDGEIITYPFIYQGGLGSYSLPSKGVPGRLRLTIDQDLLAASLELVQIPGTPYAIILEIIPDCVLNDGRDVITLEATVTDRANNAVVDGTLVKFIWQGGQGSAVTVDGRAALRLPAPTETGFLHYVAGSGDTDYAVNFLHVTGDRCTDVR